MRHTTIEHAGGQCLALTAALALTLAPLRVAAQPPTVDEAEVAEAEPAETEPPEAEPADAEVAEAAPAEPEGPEPVVASDPVVVEPAGPPPEPRTNTEAMRWAGIGLLATGGVAATTGLGMTIAFTILGDQLQENEEPVLEAIEQRDAMARVGGILLASGLAFVAVGGIVFTTAAKRRAHARPELGIRITPALGGLVVSGHF